jgi:hypothetical protein
VTPVRGKNGAVNRNGVVSKCCALRKNDDALDSNDALDSAVNRLDAVYATGGPVKRSRGCVPRAPAAGTSG